MQEELRRAGQEIQFEVALGGLLKPNGSSVDIENSLVELSQVRGITYPQARQVLGVAVNNLSSWVEVTDADTVIAAVSPSIDAFRTPAEASDDEKVKSEFYALSSKIVAGVVLVEPKFYDDRLARLVREGRFGEPKIILSTVAATLLDNRERDRAQEYGDEDSVTIAKVLDDVIAFAFDDPIVVEPLKPSLPLEWLDGDFGEKELRQQFPHVHQFLEQPLAHLVDPEERHIALARMFVASGETQRENLKERIMEGEFGNSFETLGKLVGALTSEETEGRSSRVASHDVDAVAEDLWIDLLEINRRDARLRPLRERLIKKQWYWDIDSAIYTLVETVDGMAIPIGEEEPFLAKQEETIVRRLLDIPQYGDKETHRKYRDGLELTRERGELSGRLAVVLGEVRQILEYRPGVENIISNELLLASLYTPVKSNSPKEQ